MNRRSLLVRAGALLATMGAGAIVLRSSVSYSRSFTWIECYHPPTDEMRAVATRRPIAFLQKYIDREIIKAIPHESELGKKLWADNHLDVMRWLATPEPAVTPIYHIPHPLLSSSAA